MTHSLDDPQQMKRSDSAAQQHSEETAPRGASDANPGNLLVQGIDVGRHYDFGNVDALVDATFSIARASTLPSSEKVEVERRHF